MLERFRRAHEDPETTTRKRFARRQWTRRWSRLRAVGVGALVLLLVGLGVWLVYFSPVLAVEGSEVEGSRLLSDDQVRQAAEVPSGRPLARVDVDAIAENLEELPEVASADVSRKWPDELLLKVTERVAVGVVESEGTFLGIDESGFVFRELRSRPKVLPLIRVDEGTDVEIGATDEVLEEGAAVVAALPRRVARSVEHVELTTVDRISLHLRDGRTVEWGSADQSEDKAAVLTALLKQEAEVYDVSVPGQPTTR